MLRFAEDACVQCGLCKATCPEKVISLKPQLDFRAATAMSRIIKQEDPFECIRCGKPFGVKSTVERVVAKLEGKHWMFKDSKKRLDVIRMCEDCRVTAMAEEQFRPVRDDRHARRCAPPRIICASATRRHARARANESYFFVVTRPKNSTSALRSSSEPIFCSGILVPGV